MQRKLLNCGIFILLILLMNSSSGTYETYNNLVKNSLESYSQDFSDWTNITRAGDQPNAWILDSDPAEYQTVSGPGGGTAGSHLNLNNPGLTLTNYNYDIEFKYQFTVSSAPLVRRFLRLYFYYTDGTVFVPVTIHLWDEASTIHGAGGQTTITWEPNQWHTIKIEARIFGDDLQMNMTYDGQDTNLEGFFLNGTNQVLDYCSFYLYQNYYGTGDSILVDDFKINELYEENATIYYTTTVTNKITNIINTTQTIPHTNTIETTQTVQHTNTIETTQTIQIEETKSEVNFYPLYFTGMFLALGVIIVKKRSN
jgi:hypothetical protein